MRPRLIPMLTLEDGYVVKTRKFKRPVYIGDPINTVKIFNDKEVDELAVVDIRATVRGQEPDYQHLEDIANESFMPLSYGGGVRSVEQIRRILRLGFEKIILNTAAVESPELVRAAAEETGSQSIVAAIDFKRSVFGGYYVTSHSGKKKTPESPVDFARKLENQGAGEIVLNHIDRDGTRLGYDIDLVNKVVSAVNIPVIACGGAGQWNDMRDVIKQGGPPRQGREACLCFMGNMTPC